MTAPQKKNKKENAWDNIAFKQLTKSAIDKDLAAVYVNDNMRRK